MADPHYPIQSLHGRSEEQGGHIRDSTRSTVRGLLDKDPLSGFDRQIIAAEVFSRFNAFLTTSPSSRLIGSLYPFASQPPFCYWASDTVTLALAQLEKDRSRTLEAFRIRRGVLDRGIQSLFRLSPTALIEDQLDVTNPQDLVRLSSEFLPDYLRLAEHVFMNLLELYWSVLKKGGAEGGFDSSKAVARIKALKLERLLRGYSAEVRNAIAHGKVIFTGFGIEFGVERPDVQSASDFLHYYDDLRRTCNSLIIALLLFWERISSADKLGGSVPTALVERFAAGAVDRTGLKLLGIVESKTPLAGKQLHVALRMDMRQRTMVFAYTAYIARQLIEAGAEGYDRFVVQVDHGLGVSSLVIVKSKVLEGLLKDEVPADRLPEAFPDTQLLWFNESGWKTRLRGWQTILRTGLTWLRIDVLRRWHEQGIWIGKGRYRIREVELLGSQGIARVKVRAVLKNPADASNTDVVRAVLADIVTKYRRRLVRSRGQFLDSGVPWPKLPKYVWVELYRVDGTLRWLRQGGWVGGNLVAVAESIRGRAKPVLIAEPQEIFKRVRIRYTMDAKEPGLRIS